MEKERSQKRVKPEKRSEPKKEVKSLKRSDLKKGMKPSKRIELKKLVKSSKRSKLTKRVKCSKERKLKKRATPPKGSELKEVDTLKQKLIGSLENEKKDQTVTNVSVVENAKEEAEVFQAFNDVTMSVNYEEATKFLPKPKESRLRCPGIRDMKSLYTAAATGQVKCVQKLINTGVNFNFYNEYGWTALHCAVVTGDHLCLKTLLKAGANCSVRAGRPVSKVEVDLNFASETPLHVAARYDCVTCAEELIEFGADCDAVNSKGYTSLHIAAEVGSKQFILFLLQNSHGLFSLSSTSFDGSIPLHYAIDSRMVECVKEMVRLGSNVNHPNRYGVTPLHILLVTYANDGIDFEILKCLILKGSADINSVIEESYTPVDLAIARRNLQLVDLLVACGAYVNFKNLLYPSSIDYGLFAKWGLDILNYIVTHVSRLPRLKSVLDPLDENLHSGLRLASCKTGLCIEVTGLEEVKIIEEKLGSNVIINVPESMQYPLQQPFLDVIYERIIKKLDDIKRDFDSVTDIWDLNPEKMRERTHLFVLERQLWYERIACNPLTLKDCCRISIRKWVGLHVEEIRKLPLPECLRSYLLLQSKE